MTKNSLKTNAYILACLCALGFSTAACSSSTPHTRSAKTRSLARTPQAAPQPQAAVDRSTPQQPPPTQPPPTKPSSPRLRTLTTPELEDADDPPEIAPADDPQPLEEAPNPTAQDAPPANPLPLASDEGVLEGEEHVHDEDEGVDGSDIPEGADHATYYPLPKGYTRLKDGEIEIRSVNTRERVRVKLFDSKGRVRSSAAKALRKVMRDHRKKRSRTMSTRLLIVLYLIAQEYNRPIELISGYRVGGRKRKASRRRRKGRKRARRRKGRKRRKAKRRRSRGRVKRSKHGTGEAADIRLPGVPPEDLAWFVRSRFESVGVGYYPTSLFVHVDVRKVSFYWRDPSGPGQPQRLFKVPIKPTPPKGTDWTVRSKRLPADLRKRKK